MSDAKYDRRGGVPAASLKRDRAAAAVAALLVVALLLFSRQSRLKSDPPETLQMGRGLNVADIDGQEVAWELPIGNATGVAFFAHGCNHGAGDLWRPSAACPACLGLPEEVRLRQAVLRRSLALIAVSSLVRTGKRCWREVKTDGGAAVAGIIGKVMKRERLCGLPLYLVGASSGGEMVLNLPRIMDVQGVYAQVRGVDNSVLKLPAGARYPPTAFVHMPRDTAGAARIHGNMAALRAAGTPVLEVRIPPRPVTAEFLAQRSPLIGAPAAARAIAALQRGGLLAANGSVTEPPRRRWTKRWAPKVAPLMPGLSLTLDESDLAELINLAWAQHELVSDEAGAVLAWLQGGGKGGLEEARQRAQREAAGLRAGGHWARGPQPPSRQGSMQKQC